MEISDSGGEPSRRLDARRGAAQGLAFLSAKVWDASSQQTHGAAVVCRMRQMLDLAIIGGGPGGLVSAWYLKKKLGPLCRVTIF